MWDTALDPAAASSTIIKDAAAAKLGQNFLVSPAAQAAIADALGDVSRRTVVEIGPGRGAITAILAARARRLVAIELDRNFTANLREQFANRPSVEILEQNVLATDFAALRGAEDEKLLIVGNLPTTSRRIFCCGSSASTLRSSERW